MDTVKQIIVMRSKYPDSSDPPKLRKVRTGKMVAQGAHASVAFLTSRLRDQVMNHLGWNHLIVETDEQGGEQWLAALPREPFELKPIQEQAATPEDIEELQRELAAMPNDPMSHLVASLPADTQFSLTLSYEEMRWVAEKFTKICVGVESEVDLLAVYNAAKSAGLTAHLIRDAGDTEFGGKPTLTALGIGPHYSSLLKPITGDLPLL